MVRTIQLLSLLLLLLDGGRLLGSSAFSCVRKRTSFSSSTFHSNSSGDGDDSSSSATTTMLRSSSSSSSSSSSLQPGDTIAVIGASGNVGKLVALRLSDTYNVHGIVRDASSVRSFFSGRLVEKGGKQKKEKKDITTAEGNVGGSIKLFEVDLLDELEKLKYGVSSSGGSGGDGYCPETLLEPLSTANAIVICTGTTAFPTEAWSRNGEKDVKSDVLSSLWETKFNIKEAINKLDSLGLNTPNNIDSKGNRLLIDAWEHATSTTITTNTDSDTDSDTVPATQKKRAILLSSIGVQRRTDMPFPILNACGVLDAKADAESYLINKSSAGGGKSDSDNDDDGFSYTIIRPGQLFGGPYDNNYYLGTLFQLDKDVETQNIDVDVGDTLLGDTLRSTLAEITAQICETHTAINTDFAVVNVKGPAPTVPMIQNKLQQLTK